MTIAVYVFVVLGAFLMGTLTSWVAKDYIDAFIDNAAYAKAVTHPEMLNPDGTVNQSELLTLNFLSEDDEDYEDPMN